MFFTPSPEPLKRPREEVRAVFRFCICDIILYEGVPLKSGHLCGGYTRPFAEATHSSSRGLTLDYANGIQARENHKSVNGVQLNDIRVWQMHNVNALHRRLHTRLQGATPSYMRHSRRLGPISLDNLK